MGPVASSEAEVKAREDESLFSSQEKALKKQEGGGGEAGQQNLQAEKGGTEHSCIG